MLEKVNVENMIAQQWVYALFYVFVILNTVNTLTLVLQKVLSAEIGP